LQLVAQTRDLALAQQWLALLPALEAVVAKKSDGHYAPGRRDWVKVKRQRTVDCVVIGLAGHAANPALVLGLRHADGILHHLRRLGVSSVILSGRGACRFERFQSLFRRQRAQ
jgi:ATP-dependent DNA ligase